MNYDLLQETLPEWSLQEVTLRAAQPEEIAAAGAALAREHCLGAPRPCHREVVQLAVRGDQVLAVVVCTRAARKLAGREAWLGWDPRTRTRRLPLLVQNNRFRVRAAARQPNLAGRVLGLAVAARPADWEKRTGTRPLLAETFVDPERYAGTCYKAAGWIEHRPHRREPRAPARPRAHPVAPPPPDALRPGVRQPQQPPSAHRPSRPLSIT